MVAKKFTLFLVLMCLFLSFASAEFEVIRTQVPQPDFTVYSSADVSSCECASSTDYLYIANVYPYAQTFYLSSDNELINLPSTQIIVGGGDTLAVPYQILTPCDARSQSFTIYVQGPLETKELTKDLSVLQCQNLAVSIPQQNIETGICQEFLSEFRIENIGVYEETYYVDAKNFKQYASVQSQQVTIPAGSYADIAFNYQFACDMDETYFLSYDVESVKSGVKARVDQSVTVTDTYDYGVELTQPSGTCIGDQSYFEITIENRNEFNDFFTIDIDAPGFVDVQYPTIDGKETKTVVLDGNTKTSLGVFVTPSNKRDFGVNDITVYVASKYAQSSQSALTNITVYECYDFDNVFVSHPGTISTCGQEEFTRTIEVAHQGYGSPTLELSSSNELVTFANNSISFDGQESKNATLIFTVPRNLTSRNTVTLQASFREKVVDEMSFSLFTDTDENCYLLSPVKDSVKLYEDSEYFTLKLQHLGDRESSYEALLEKSPAYVSLLTNDFNLSPGRRTSLLFQIDRDILFDDAFIFNNGSIIGLNADASLVVSNEHSTHQDEFMIEFVDYPWYVKAWGGFISLKPCFMIFIILVLLIIIFGIIGIIKTTHHNYFRSNNVFALIALIVLIVAAIYIYFSFGLPDNPYKPYDLSTNSTTHIKMVEGKDKVLELDNFFFDPDHNLVEFGIASYIPAELNFTKPDNTSIVLRSIDYVGNTSISLYVVDAGDEAAVSPDIVVEILPEITFTLPELFDQFCYYVNLVLLFILLLIMYIAFSFRKRPKEKQLTIEQAQKEQKKEDQKPISSTKTSPKKSSKKASSKTSKKSASKKKSAKKKSSKK